jgi:hypothetical protein
VVLETAAAEEGRVMRGRDQGPAADRHGPAAGEAEARFAVEGQAAADGKLRLQRQPAEMDEQAMPGLVPVHVPVRHVEHGPHVGDLRGQEAVQLASVERDPRRRGRDLDGLRPEAGLKLPRRERVMDRAQVDAEVGIREERRVLRPRILRPGRRGARGGGAREDHDTPRPPHHGTDDSSGVLDPALPAA